MNTKIDQKGLAHLGLVIVGVLVLGVIGFAGYHVMQKDKLVANNPSQTITKSKETNSSTTPAASAYASLKLDSDKVQFEIPKTWTVSKSNCIDSPGAAPACVDGAALVPAQKMPTIYGGGTEYFTIYVGVYDNASNKSAQRWFEDVYQGGSASSSDKVSSESINGYNTYYFEQINKSYDEIRYVYTANGKAVYLSARISEKGFDSNGKVNASSDFTNYRPEIEKMAKSVKID